MILYLIHDSTKNTYSHPMVAPSLDVLKASLYECFPSNSEDLQLQILCSFKNLSELPTLRPNPRAKKNTIIPFNSIITQISQSKSSTPISQTTSSKRVSKSKSKSKSKS